MKRRRAKETGRNKLKERRRPVRLLLHTEGVFLLRERLLKASVGDVTGHQPDFRRGMCCQEY